MQQSCYGGQHEGYYPGISGNNGTTNAPMGGKGMNTYQYGGSSSYGSASSFGRSSSACSTYAASITSGGTFASNGSSFYGKGFDGASSYNGSSYGGKGCGRPSSGAGKGCPDGISSLVIAGRLFLM